MIGIIPYRVDVPMERWPFANIALIAINCVVFVLQVSGEFSELEMDSLVLDGLSMPGLFTHMFLHAGVLHLVGNMVFLWAFGNAVCAKVGNLRYLVLYVAFGLCAALAFITFDEGRAIGASGAINGVVGAFFVLYPLNELSCVWVFWIRVGQFEVDSRWMILYWFVFDVFYAAVGAPFVAYSAHVGGFIAGFFTIWFALDRRLLVMTEHERSLHQIYHDWRRASAALDGARPVDDGRARHQPAARETEFDLGENLVDASRDVPELIEARCLYCTGSVHLPENHDGADVHCPDCGSRIVIARAG